MNRYLKLYYGSTHLAAFALFMRLTVVIFAIERLHNDYLLVNALFAAGALAYGTGALTVARLSDRFERRLCAVWGLMAVTVASLTFILGGTHTAFFFVYFMVSAIGFSLFFPALQGILAERTSKRLELGRGMSRYNFCWSSGDFVGGILAAWLIDRFTSSTLGLLQITLGLGMAMDVVNMGLLFMARKIDHENDKAGENEDQDVEALPDASSQRRLPRFAQAGRWGLFFASAAMSIGMANFPKYAQDHGLSENVAALMFAGMPLANAIFLFWYGPRRFWRFNGPLHLASQSLMVVGLLMLGLWPTALGLSLGLFLAGSGFATSFTLSLFYSLMCARVQGYQKQAHAAMDVGGIGESLHAYGQESGISEACLGMGQILGPLLCIVLMLLRQGDSSFFLCGAGLAIISLLAQAFILKPPILDEALEGRSEPAVCVD